MSADESAKIEQWLALAKGARGRAIADLIAKATAEPGLFGYAELLAAPSIQEASVQG
jgi:COP9 signalosome complex subunit 7